MRMLLKISRTKSAKSSRRPAQKFLERRRCQNSRTISPFLSSCLHFFLDSQRGAMLGGVVGLTVYQS